MMSASIANKQFRPITFVPVTDCEGCDGYLYKVNPLRVYRDFPEIPFTTIHTRHKTAQGASGPTTANQAENNGCQCEESITA
jgi:hypothetical protein